MLDLLLGILGRLIDLAKYRGERARRIFTDVLHPVFTELEPVHRNYCDMFEEVFRSLPESARAPGAQASLLSAAENLRRRRIEFEPVRVKLAAMARETLGGRFANTKRVVFSPEVDRFLHAVVDYFPSGYLSTPDATSASTALYAALRTGASPITPEDLQNEGDALKQLVAHTLEDCRRRWQVVCELHAALSVAVAATD